MPRRRTPAAAIHGTLARTGQRVEVEDCLIEGIALGHREPALTLNPKHFSRVRGLVVHTPA
jgi:predicted nucleic acid-binding protein